MVWLAVSKKCVSKPYIQESGIAFNAETYVLAVSVADFFVK